MASHLSSVGFTQELDALIERVRTEAATLSSADPGQRVRLLRDPSGGVVTLTETLDGTPVCLTPALDATPTVRVVPTGFAEDAACPLCSRLTCEVLDENGDTVTAFAVGVADLGFSRNAFRRGRPVDLRMGAYTYAITVYRDESDFRRHEQVRATRSLLASGLFRPAGAAPNWTPTAHVLLTGVVSAARWEVNRSSGARFAVLTVDTYGFTVDLAADPQLLTALPEPGAIVDARAGLVALYAGPLSDLIDEARPAASTAGPAPAAPPAPGPVPAAPPARDPARDGRVLAALVASATATPGGVIATCADADLRWQLRRFPPGGDEPDRVANLPGWAEISHVTPEGTAVLCGTTLLLFDPELRPRASLEVPADATVALVHGRSVVWVVLERLAPPGTAPDPAGRAAQQRGDTVHEFEVWRVPVTGTDHQDRYLLDRSAIYRRTSPETAPVWEGVFRDGLDGRAMWTPVPGESGGGVPVQHLIEVGETGPPQVRTVFGPEWELSRLRLDDVTLVADTTGLRADEDRIAGSGRPVRSRWFAAGEWVLGVMTALDGSTTTIVELERGVRIGARPLLTLDGNFDVSAAPGWLLAASWSSDAYLLQRGDGGRILLRDRVVGHPTLLSVHGGRAVLVTHLPDSPGVDLHTGTVVPAAQMAAATYVMLSSLVEMAVDR